MLKEERLLRDSIDEECGGMPLDIKRQITALVRAVREDERKLANEDFLRDRARGIPAIRSRK